MNSIQIFFFFFFFKKDFTSKNLYKVILSLVCFHRAQRDGQITIILKFVFTAPPWRSNVSKLASLSRKRKNGNTK